jgi:DNA adenine methylase
MGNRLRSARVAAPTAFPYYGSKTRLAAEIVALFPPHRVYVEPFAGSAAVLLAKPPVEHEILNDRNGAIVAFFRVLRDRPDDLLDVLRLTPYARDEFIACRLDEPVDDLELARRWWVRSGQALSGIVRSSGASWSCSSASGASKAKTLDRRLGRLVEVADRLRGVIVDSREALDVVASHGRAGAVIYADPPYLGEARSVAGGYIDDAPTDDYHRRLLAVLDASPATVVVSGYRSPLYDEALAGWHRVDVDVVARATGGDGGSKDRRVECLWLNRSVERRLF